MKHVKITYKYLISAFSKELARSAPGCRTGAISSARWKASDGLWRSYAYTYDRAGRLAAADYSEDERTRAQSISTLLMGKPADYSAEYSYDPGSNLTAITRKGIGYKVFSSNISYTVTPFIGAVDDLTLTYDRGRLVSVSDAADNGGAAKGRPDFPDMADTEVEYTYDANGALTSDLNRGLTRITRNRLGLPERVEAGDHSRLEHVYSASGELLRRVSCSYGFVPVLPMSLSATPIPGGALHKEVYDRCGPFEYTDSVLSRVLFPGGYISGGVAYNFVHDWQGNVRQVVDGSTGEPVQETHYYPYGMPFAESAVSELRHIKASCTNPYRFGGKEWVTDHGADLYDFGARGYNYAIGGWDRIDDLCDKNTGHSVYGYCGGDPINYNDPDGRDAKLTILERTITVEANIYIYGEYATKKLAHTYQNDINNTWGKITKFNLGGVTYNVVWKVSVNVLEEGQAKDYNGVNNYFSVFRTKDGNKLSDPKLKHTSYVNLDGHNGELRTTGRYGFTLWQDCPISHEFGHLLGLFDKYGEDGKPISNKWDGDIMAMPTYELNRTISNDHLNTLFKPLIDLHYNPLLIVLKRVGAYLNICDPNKTIMYLKPDFKK